MYDCLLRASYKAFRASRLDARQPPADHPTKSRPTDAPCNWAVVVLIQRVTADEGANVPLHSAPEPRASSTSALRTATNYYNAQASKSRSISLLPLASLHHQRLTTANLPCTAHLSRGAWIAASIQPLKKPLVYAACAQNPVPTPLPRSEGQEGNVMAMLRTNRLDNDTRGWIMCLISGAGELFRYLPLASIPC